MWVFGDGEERFYREDGNYLFSIYYDVINREVGIIEFFVC